MQLLYFASKRSSKSLFWSVFTSKGQDVKVLESFLKHVSCSKTFIKDTVVWTNSFKKDNDTDKPTKNQINILFILCIYKCIVEYN